MPKPFLSGRHRPWPALLCAGAVVVWLAACKNECPPLSIQEGEFCRWTHDGGVAGGSSYAGKAAGRAGRGGRSAGGGNSGSSGMAAASEGDPTAWTCQQADVACNCVQGDGNGEDACTSPKPDCCYVYSEGGKDHCSCVPVNSPACSELFTRDGSGVAATCPL
jgi:hypothetical protein